MEQAIKNIRQWGGDKIISIQQKGDTIHIVGNGAFRIQEIDELVKILGTKKVWWVHTKDGTATSYNSVLTVVLK
jgi:hypothetical protein